MKKLKILTSLVLMLVLCFSVVPFVNAAETYKITINKAQDGHVYEAYQIFSGDLSTKDGNKILSNIEWGSDVNETALTKALKDNEIITDDKTLESAAKIAETLTKDFTDDSENLIKFADAAGKNLKAGATGKQSGTITDGVTEIIDLTPGYYLVKDTMPSKTDETENVVYSLFLLQVVGDAVTDQKAYGPRVEKTVANSADYADEATWNSATVGENVYFKIKATLPTNMKGYDSYKFEIADTMGAGFKLVSDSIVVKMDGTPLIDTVSATETYYTISNGLTFDIININTETSAGKEVIITYSATLEDDTATRGNIANENTVILTYSNDPHNTGSTGYTKASTKTYTENIELHKIDVTLKEATDKEGLPGAVFNVYEEGKTEVLRTGTTTTDGKLVIGGLKAGTYEIEEITPPVGFNQLSGRIKVKLEVTEDGTWTATKISEPDLTNTPIAIGKGENEIIKLEVTNKSGTNLPSTGGVGTVIFTVVGLAIMGTVVVIAIGTNKKGARSRK